MSKISSKIIVFSFLICIFSILATVIINSSSISTIMKDQILSKLEETTERYATEIDNWFEMQGKIVNEIHSELIFGNNFDGDYLIKYFDYKNSTNTDIKEYYLAFANNVFVRGFGYWFPEGDYNVLEREWYIKAVNSDDVIISSPYVDANHGEVIVTIAKAIRINGDIVGVLGSDIAIDHIVNIINQIKPSKSGYGFLVDSNGNILAHPNSQFIFSNDKGLVNIKDIYNTDILDLPKDGVLKLKPIKDYDGIEKFFLHTNLDFTNWVVGFTIVENEVYSPLKKVVNNSIVLSIIMTIISIILSFILGNSLSKPIKSATQYIENMSKLDISIEVDSNNLNRKDEIGTMYRSFQNIKLSLRNFIDNLNFISEKISNFSVELDVLSQKSSNDADNIASVFSNVSEINQSQMNKLLKIYDSLNNISKNIDNLCEFNQLQSNCETSLQEVKKEIDKVITASNITREIGLFESGQIQKFADLTEMQKLMMEEIWSASQCLRELGEELNEYIGLFKR